MSVKISFIGGGSNFGNVITRDILARKVLQHAHVCLMDVHAERLEATRQYIKKIVETNKLPAKITCTTDREEALRDADFVILSISAHGRAYSGEPYASEINIPRKYGVDQGVGDTVGVGAVFRYLRTAPVMMDIFHDMEKWCPDALALNYVNPMAMLTWTHSVGSSIKNVGLCHGVQGTTKKLCRIANADYDQCTFKCGGINHQAWILELAEKGQDLYPVLWDTLKKDPDVYNEDKVRFELMKHFGYFLTESSKHASEYLPYFRTTQERREYFGLESREVPEDTGQGPEWLKDSTEGASMDNPVDLTPSHEYAAGIIEAIVANEPFCFYGNVMNDRLITNLPGNCCVEVKCTADADGITPEPLGDLPVQCAALNRTNISVQELAVKAFMENDREAAFHAVAVSPLTAAVLPLHKIREMFEELWATESDLLTIK